MKNKIKDNHKYKSLLITCYKSNVMIKINLLKKDFG